MNRHLVRAEQDLVQYWLVMNAINAVLKNRNAERVKNGYWTTEEIKEAFDNGVMAKVWPKLYEAIKLIVAESLNEESQK